MRLTRAMRPPRVAVAALILASALLAWLLMPAGETAEASKPRGRVRVAESVCDAHKLKAAREQNPRLQIEIPPEHDKPFPTLSACLAHDEAWNDALPGPRQPIPFSHKHHSGGLEMDCLYCHSGTDRSRMAGVPSVQICMGCHLQFPPEYDQLEGIRILKSHWEDKRPIAWQQIHRLPEHVKFSHSRHQATQVTCQQCHGLVQELDRLHLVPDDAWRYFVPVAKMQMGWCVQCHDQSRVSKDCLLCHY